MKLKVCRSLLSDNVWSGENTGIGKIYILPIAMFCLDLGKIVIQWR